MFANYIDPVKLHEQLISDDQSLRLKTALAAGTYPQVEYIDYLIAQCATETDFFVRDMLTWALIRNDINLVAQKLETELLSESTQARSQALHTFSKIADKKYFALITDNLLFDKNDSVATTAWRAASVLASQEDLSQLIPKLVTQLGRGSFEIQLSLSRSICTLGDLVKTNLIAAQLDPKVEVSKHAEFTLKLLLNPDLENRLSMEFAKRISNLTGAPTDPKII